MVRPRICRRVRFNPKTTYFKPQGIPMRQLEEVDLGAEELEAVRLCDLKGFDQAESAKKMNVSTSTFQRVLYSAREKIAKALVDGKAIKISKEK